jgi:hypothetical protein
MADADRYAEATRRDRTGNKPSGRAHDHVAEVERYARTTDKDRDVPRHGAPEYGEVGPY